MMSFRSIRDAALATLLAFGSGCVIYSSPYPTSQPAAPTSRPKKAKKPAAKKPPRPAAKPPARPVPPKPARPPTAKPKPPPKPAPRPNPPKPAPEPDDLPKGTHMVVPVRVAFAEAVERVDALIIKTAKQGWQTVSAKNAPTKVEVKYEVWRDPIQASFADGRLKVVVKVHYAADIRASAKNPLGGGTIWLTKGQTWGTRAEPQDLRAEFSAGLAIRDDFRVDSNTRLEDLDHGHAPSGTLCAGLKIIKVCIGKDKIAPMVHKKLEAQLVPQIEKALASADKEIEKALNLKPQAERLWSGLQQPQQLQKIGQANCPSQLGAVCSTPAWLVAKPEALGVSQPRMDGKDLRVDVAFAGQLAVELGDKPKVEPTALPRLSPVTGAPGFAVRARVQVPLPALAEEIERHLKSKPLGDRIYVAKVALVDGDRRHPRRVQVVVGVTGALTAELKVAGELAWDAKKGELALKDVDLSLVTDDPALKKLSQANLATLRKLIAEHARWKLGTKTAALGKAITDALDNVWHGHLDVDGQLDRLSIEEFSVTNKMVSVDVVIGGQLAVSLTP